MMPFIGGSHSALQVSLPYEAACVTETTPLPGPDRNPALKKHLRLRSQKANPPCKVKRAPSHLSSELSVYIFPPLQTLKELLCLP